MLEPKEFQQIAYLKDIGGAQELLGCSNCLDAEMCGGLHLRVGSVDSCFSHCTCTGKQVDECDVVCPRRPIEFVKRMVEVRSFDLNNIPLAKNISSPNLPNYIPLLHGRGARTHREKVEYLAIPMARALIGRGQSTRARTTKELIAVTGIEPSKGWILSGTDDDGPIERIWALEHRQRIFKDMRAAGVLFATTPNYSLYADVPRHDNMHAMKRIAWMWYLMQQAGVPTALHINGRTDKDFERWAEFVRRQKSVKVVAFEFTTGAESLLDRQRYVSRLETFSAAVERPLSLVVRGSAESAQHLQSSFAKITRIDSTAYQRAIHRRKAFVSQSGSIQYSPVTTTTTAQVAALFKNNDEILRASASHDLSRFIAPQRNLDFTVKNGTLATRSPTDMNTHDESAQIDLFAQQPVL